MSSPGTTSKRNARSSAVSNPSSETSHPAARSTASTRIASKTSPSTTHPAAMSSSKEIHLGPTTIPAKQQYLALYNGLSLLLWAHLLLRTILIATAGSLLPASFLNPLGDDTTVLENIYLTLKKPLIITQSLALLEPLHSLLGVVRAPLLTTLMQVASRLLLVWGIVFLLGSETLQFGAWQPKLGAYAAHMRGAIGEEARVAVAKNQAAFAGMVVAWSLAECVRYGFFAAAAVFDVPGQGAAEGKREAGGVPGGVPSWLVWLRYNAFYVLYPVGISCEVWLVYRSLAFAREWSVWYQYFLLAALAIYVPGSYVLYTHMIKQRRRVMRGKARAS